MIIEATQDTLQFGLAMTPNWTMPLRLKRFADIDAVHDPNPPSTSKHAPAAAIIHPNNTPATVWSVEDPPARLRRTETILLNRTSRITLVVDRAIDYHNVSAIFRTADALGTII